MLEFIVNSLVWILAIYGLFEIIKEIIHIFTCTGLNADGIYIIVATKNQEDKIEGFMRTVLFRLIYGKDEIMKNIIVTDLDSQDDTKQILMKLEKDYDIVKYLSWKECKELIENVNIVENTKNEL